MFGFQKLDVYRLSVEFLTIAAPSSDKIPKGYSGLGDQLRRASSSISLNIAEGSGKFNKDARRFYAIARGSALECAAIYDALLALGFIDRDSVEKSHAILNRIVAMLTVMIRQ